MRERKDDGRVYKFDSPNRNSAENCLRSIYTIRNQQNMSFIISKNGSFRIAKMGRNRIRLWTLSITSQAIRSSPTRRKTHD